ncbi:MAG: FAD-dependent oxidoreductase [Rubripirellula sp.]|nr:FAD-dependent oxidoreductase [Rubripirellula sp.]
MHCSLPKHLDERFRWRVSPTDVGARAPGDFVLYWMHNALRCHENPALDAAICLARQNGLPLLVYHGLSEDYPYASDRYHAFILQGHRDVQRELADRGIQAFFHLQQQGDRGPHLRTLTRQAAVLVSEEMPVQPLEGWMERLASGTKTPIAMVDASCVVPIPMVKKSYTRAYEFRDATREMYAERVELPYEEQTFDCEVYEGPLPFKPLDLQSATLSELIGRSKVDHAIAPVSDTPGGSRAGYARWESFKKHGLDQYANRRNDAANHDGVSRMSAYLHFGMVSPMRIAREAHERGAEKYLDELLIWRELSFHFCYHNIDVIDSIDSLPSWAQRTLEDHASDPRTGSYGWEQLARGRSDQPLWDACQRGLLKHGEMHNNVRMTWGKAFLHWASTPAKAMRLTMDLNHRYALDGRDPSSYGGVLWCFGQFDRPFKPEKPVTGMVRERSVDDHQKRIDFDRYLRVVDRPIAAKLPKVAVIGAGMGGLICGRTLLDHGIDVTILEKSRSVGGRLATRRVPDNAFTFDHGAQYFTAKDQRFSRYVQCWILKGLVEPWMGRIVELGSDGEVIEEKLGTPRYVGVPSMNAVAMHLAEDLKVSHGVKIDRLLSGQDGKWLLLDDQGQEQGRYDTVIVNCPPAQTSPLVAESDFADLVGEVEMNPCWALLVAAKSLKTLPFEGAFVNDGPISWISRNDRKPGRNETPCIVAHASPEWSKQNLELDPDVARQKLRSALEKTIGQSLSEVEYETAHRWRYSVASNPLSQECLWDPVSSLGACGDWCNGSRIEGAFLSGMAMAGSVLRHWTIDRAGYRVEGPQQLSLLSDVS